MLIYVMDELLKGVRKQTPIDHDPLLVSGWEWVLRMTGRGLGGGVYARLSEPLS